MLSAIVQKVTGEKVVDYLNGRLFEPLHIDKPKWEESPQGINTGGWGLWLKTEDLAKMGQLLLQKGEWNGKQLIPAEWVAEMSKKQVESINPGTRMEEAEAKGMTKETSDWMQGYGYQMWRCRPGCFRADGARGQYIIVVPDKNAVIAITSGKAFLHDFHLIKFMNSGRSSRWGAGLPSAWILCNRNAMLVARVRMVCMPSVSSFTSPFPAPYAMFQY